MISPSISIAGGGTQIQSPKAWVTRSAMLVLPFPGLPNRKRPRPELMAGPSRRNMSRLISRSLKAFSRSALVGWASVRVWMETLRMYCFRVTGAAPK